MTEDQAKRLRRSEAEQLDEPAILAAMREADAIARAVARRGNAVACRNSGPNCSCLIDGGRCENDPERYEPGGSHGSL